MSAMCPDVEILRRFALAHTADAEMEALAAHVEHWPRCLQVLYSLPDQDALSDAGAVNTESHGPGRAEAVRALLSRRNASRPADLPVGPSTAADATPTPTRWPTPIPTASCIATSSRPTSWWAPSARSRSWTGA